MTGARGPVEIMERDHKDLAVLSRQECLRRLGPGGVGRVAVTVRALPVASHLPSARQRDFRPYGPFGGGSTMRSRGDVGWEAEMVTVSRHSGIQVIDADQCARPWPSGERSRRLCLRPSCITGRVVGPVPSPAPQ